MNAPASSLPLLEPADDPLIVEMDAELPDAAEPSPVPGHRAAGMPPIGNDACRRRERALTPFNCAGPSLPSTSLSLVAPGSATGTRTRRPVRQQVAGYGLALAAVAALVCGSATALTLSILFGHG